MNFETLYKKYYAEDLSGLSNLTIKVRNTDLKRFFDFFDSTHGHTDATKWYPVDNRQFVESMESKGYSFSYINRNISSIRAFGNFLCQTRLLDHNPVRKLKELKLEYPEPQALTKEEWNSLQESADALIAAPASIVSQAYRDKVVMLTLENSGLRIEELLSLRIDQFRNNAFIRVRTKNSRIRSSVAIKSGVAKLIRDYIEGYRIPGSPFLFTNRYGQRLSRNGIAAAFSKIAEGLHIDLWPHRFRHTHGKNVYQLTKDPLLTAKRLGHSGAGYVLERYATPSDKEIEEIINII